jgi:hypothetical protein
VAWFGTYIEAKLDEIEGKKPEQTRAMRERALKVMLTDRPAFRDPLESGKVPVTRSE